MFKRSLIVLTLAGACIFAASAVAQDNGSNQPPAQSGDQSDHWHGHHMDPAKRTEMLTKQLKLTADQQPKVLEILKSEQSQMETLRSDSSASEDDRHAKMMDLRKSSNDQIRALLDANQQKKFDEMQSRREHWQDHGPNQ
jgi:Spy/CpxP family protein refolding chaperone